MKTISEAALKKAIRVMQAERSKHPLTFQPDRQQRATLQKGRRETEKMLTAFLEQSGFDIAKFRALQERRGAEFERMVAKHKADALRLASPRKDTLRSNIVAQSKALGDLISRNDFFPHPSFSLDTPFFIGGTPAVHISSSEATPFGSWAKFKFSTSEYQAVEKAGFYFQWANQFSDYAVITAVTFMSATGFLTAHVPWMLDVGESSVTAYALLNLGFNWPNTPTITSYAREYLGRADAWTVLFPATDGEPVSSGLQLIAPVFAVPPQSVAVFEVVLELDYKNDPPDGDIEADFESGGFQIACPVVVVELLNSPPGATARLAVHKGAR